MEYRQRNGFTLIELSITLVIIGLIVGGVLVGQDLIHAARIRSQISQIEHLRTAVLTFQGKYDGIPGDLTTEAAASYGMVPRAGTFGQGDGNGVITNSAGNGDGWMCGESLVFWNDLSFAQLIEGNYQGTDGTLFVSCTPGASADASLVLPPAKIPADKLIALSLDGVNYFQIEGYITTISQNGYFGGYLGGACCFPLNGISPIDAFSMDTKMDDGLPFSGAVRAMDIRLDLGIELMPAATPAVGVCVSNMSGTYNIDPLTGGNSIACSPAFNF